MNRDLILTAISLFAWGVGEGMFMFFQPIYLEQLGADPVRIGAVLGGYGAATTLALIPAGYLADRFGRRQLMWAAWILGVIAAVIMALAASLPVFVTGLLVYGLTFFVMSPLNSYVTAARGKWSVGAAILLASAAINLGMVVGPWIGGLIGERLGIQRIFFFSALVFALSTLVIFFIRPQPVEVRPDRETRLAFLANPAYIAYLGVVFLAVFATFLPQPLSQNFLSNQRSLSLAQIGRLVSLTGLGVAVLNLTLGRVNERMGFLLAQLAVAGFAFLLWRGSGPMWFAVGYFFLGGFKTTRSLAVAQTRSLVQAANMGLAYAITDTVASSAVILAPLMAGYLYSQSPAQVYPTSAILILISLLASYRFSPRKPVTIGKPMPLVVED
jgi:predicted MFS family arabinose efflux permease